MINTQRLNLDMLRKINCRQKRRNIGKLTEADRQTDRDKEKKQQRT